MSSLNANTRGRSLISAASANPPLTLIKVLLAVACFSVGFACVGQMHRPGPFLPSPAESARLIALFALGGSALAGGIGSLFGHFRAGVLIFMIWVALPMAVVMIKAPAYTSLTAMFPLL